MEKDSEVNSYIQVVLRCRPMNDKENRSNSKNIITAVNEKVLVFDPKDESLTKFGRKFTKKHISIPIY